MAVLEGPRAVQRKVKEEKAHLPPSERLREDWPSLLKIYMHSSKFPTRNHIMLWMEATTVAGDLAVGHATSTQALRKWISEASEGMYSRVSSLRCTACNCIRRLFVAGTGVPLLNFGATRKSSAAEREAFTQQVAAQEEQLRAFIADAVKMATVMQVRVCYCEVAVNLHSSTRSARSTTCTRTVARCCIVETPGPTISSPSSA